MMALTADATAAAPRERGDEGARFDDAVVRDGALGTLGEQTEGIVRMKRKLNWADFDLFWRLCRN